MSRPKWYLTRVETGKEEEFKTLKAAYKAQGEDFVMYGRAFGIRKREG